MSESTDEKLKRLGWIDDQGEEIPWDYWQRCAQWPTRTKNGSISYHTPHNLEPGRF